MLLNRKFSFYSVFHELIIALLVILHSHPTPLSPSLHLKSWILSHQYFLKQKEKQTYPKNRKILLFWCVITHQARTWFQSSTSYQTKQKINTPITVNFFILISDIINISVIIGSQMASSTKLRKFKSLRVYQATEWISIKTKRKVFLLMTSSDNKHQRDFRFIDSFLNKNFESFCPQQFFK